MSTAYLILINNKDKYFYSFKNQNNCEVMPIYSKIKNPPKLRKSVILILLFIRVSRKDRLMVYYFLNAALISNF